MSSTTVEAAEAVASDTLEDWRRALAGSDARYEPTWYDRAFDQAFGPFLVIGSVIFYGAIIRNVVAAVSLVGGRSLEPVQRQPAFALEGRQVALRDLAAARGDGFREHEWHALPTALDARDQDKRRFALWQSGEFISRRGRVADRLELGKPCRKVRRRG